MTRVNVSMRSSATAPKSDSTYSATSSPPATAAGRTCLSVTPTNVATGPRPSDRATSSAPGSARVSAAATGSSTYG